MKFYQQKNERKSICITTMLMVTTTCVLCGTLLIVFSTSVAICSKLNDIFANLKVVAAALNCPMGNNIPLESIKTHLLQSGGANALVLWDILTGRSK
ncbi:hypothetical protein ACHAW6_012079 [Cyclotella cf. meneghiniana]